MKTPNQSLDHFLIKGGSKADLLSVIDSSAVIAEVPLKNTRLSPFKRTICEGVGITTLEQIFRLGSKDSLKIKYFSKRTLTLLRGQFVVHGVCSEDEAEKW